MSVRISSLVLGVEAHEDFLEISGFDLSAGQTVGEFLETLFIDMLERCEGKDFATPIYAAYEGSEVAELCENERALRDCRYLLYTAACLAVFETMYDQGRFQPYHDKNSKLYYRVGLSLEDKELTLYKFDEINFKIHSAPPKNARSRILDRLRKKMSDIDYIAIRPEENRDSGF